MSFNNFDDSENMDTNKGKVLNDSNSSKIDALINGNRVDMVLPIPVGASAKNLPPFDPMA